MLVFIISMLVLCEMSQFVTGIFIEVDVSILYDIRFCLLCILLFSNSSCLLCRLVSRNNYSLCMSLHMLGCRNGNFISC